MRVGGGRECRLRGLAISGIGGGRLIGLQWVVGDGGRRCTPRRSSVCCRLLTAAPAGAAGPAQLPRGTYTVSEGGGAAPEAERAHTHTRSGSCTRAGPAPVVLDVILGHHRVADLVIHYSVNADRDRVARQHLKTNRQQHSSTTAGRVRVKGFLSTHGGQHRQHAKLSKKNYRFFFFAG